MDENKPNRINTIDLENDYLKLVHRNENPFPLDIFPNELQEIIFEFLNVFKFNLDYLGAGVLAAASAAIGRSHQLQVKPGWIVKANLFTVIVGKPGDAKTPALSLCFKPINKADKKYFSEYNALMDDYEKSLNDKAENKEQLNKPYLKKILMNDYTPEALILAHSYNKNGLCILVDELVSLLKNLTRYTNSGEEEALLSYWSGATISKDRTSSRSIRINDPFIGLIGGIQIGALKELAKGGKKSNGFMDRLLFVYPENLEKVLWNNNEIDKIHLTNYNNIISNLLDLKNDSQDSPVILKIEKKAQEFLNTWQNNNKTVDLFEYERGISVKLEDYIYRFSLIIQLLSSAIVEGENKAEVQLAAVKGGIKLYDYFFHNAMKVRDQLAPKNYLESLTPLKKAILKDLPNTFSKEVSMKLACKVIDGKPRISERSLHTLLKDEKLFIKVSHGEYEKVIKDKSN
ncbi:DUF3987 domain-containing protein [Polaribacter glomeratus]|uniref:DUF3987 domain-containing protein n=1 Tax=Polaribacter glomeratus TaxID=102 RepID=A0A2S7WYX5_9FLAO|nr:DUF3987 domain-containing protein [Polaribacter glomeratus]PQJ82621.1 hypothetical protein BTO16_08545 [Polaribacter glomeratus]TXD64923.1 DUF3987 domain-containing protein [Polaribacter glomeratus]